MRRDVRRSRVRCRSLIESANAGRSGVTRRREVEQALMRQSRSGSRSSRCKIAPPLTCDPNVSRQTPSLRVWVAIAQGGTLSRPKPTLWHGTTRERTLPMTCPLLLMTTAVFHIVLPCASSRSRMGDIITLKGCREGRDSRSWERHENRGN